MPAESSIGVSDETRERLYTAKGPHNTYDEYINELLDTHADCTDTDE